jgi:general secretion pathway protein L
MNMQALNIASAGQESLARLKQLRVAYVAPVERRLSAFWRWWMAQLIPLLPSSLQELVAERDERDFVSEEGESIVLRRGTLAANKALVRVPAQALARTRLRPPGSRRPRVLLLAPDDVLITPMTLPLATEENLREVVSYEIPRKTPFSADQVYFDHRIRERNAARKTIAVEVVVTPRRLVDAALEKLEALDFLPDCISVPDATGMAELPINLLPEARRPRADGLLANRARVVLTVMAVVLLIAAVSIPIVRKQQLLEQLEPQLNAALAEARESDRLRRQVEDLVAGSRYLLTKKQSEPLALETIAELTRALPDHTFINRLEVTGRRVELQGESSASASLIATLEASPMFEQVSFQSPVTQIRHNGRERFHIAATVTGGGSGE